jgi:hypothetical protein
MRSREERSLTVRPKVARMIAKCFRVTYGADSMYQSNRGYWTPYLTSMCYGTVLKVNAPLRVTAHVASAA